MFYKDLFAGVTIFIFLVPQGMATSILAGMPPVYGLYASIVPLVFYAILGTSRHLSVGPMSIIALLLAVRCQKFGYDDASPEYIHFAMNLSMLVGLTTFLMGTFRLGTLSNLISHSVLVGFLTASALVIAISQMKTILGIHMPHLSYSHEIIYYLISHLPDSNGPTVALGLTAWAALLVVRAWKKQYSPPYASDRSYQAQAKRGLFLLAKFSNFVAILLGALAARMIIRSGGSVQIVGSIPSGLKTPGFSFLPFEEVTDLIPSALAISFVAFAGNWAIAKKYALKFDYEVDATQELLGSGYATVVGVLFNAFVGSGGLARSAVNVESGAVTQISGIIAATLILVALFALTSLLYYIPIAVLAAIIETSILSMMEFEAMRVAYKTGRRDCVVMVATFLCTFFVGVTEGLFAGIFISIAVVMQASAFPRIVHLGKLRDKEGIHYEDISRFPQAEQLPGIAIVRMEASPYFANTARFKSAVVEAAKGGQHSSSDPIHLVVIDASAWIDLDLSGIEMMLQLKEELDHSKSKVQLRVAGAKSRVREHLRACNFVNDVEQVFLYFSIDDAVQGRPASRSIAPSKQPEFASIYKDERDVDDGLGIDAVNPLYV